jgi:hypothetical protein
MSVLITGIPSKLTQKITRDFKSYSYNGTTTDAFVKVIEKDVGNYSNLHFLIKETGGINSIQYQVISYLNENGQQYDIQTNTLNASSTDTFLLEKPYYTIEVWVKSGTAGNSGDYAIDLIMRG